MERIPPHDKDAEVGVLGSVLLDPPCMENITIKATDFFDRRHQALWEALCEMRNSNRPMDAITVGSWLSKQGGIDRVGGLDYLIQLQDDTVVSAHSQHYADIVAEKARLREGIALMSGGLDRFYKGEVEAKSIRCDIMSELAQGDDTEEEDIVTLCNEFVDKCKEGKVGHFQWWCPDWDYKLGRMDNELMILHAPRSTGKTAIMLQWITEAHRIKQRAPLASIEMLKKQLMPRFIANMGQVNTFLMKVRGRVTYEEESKSAKAISEIRSLELRIRDKAMTIDDIRSWAIKEHKQCERDGVKMGAIFVDNLLSISDGGKQYQSKTIMYDDFIRKFRDLRDILKVPIIILAHPNAEGGVAWSKDVENFADIILYLHRVEDEGIKVNGKHIMPMECEGVHIVAKFQKYRDGIQPVAHLDFIGETQTFKHIDWL